jgi:repressor LexA
MTRGMTKRQQEILQFLFAYHADHGYPPTLREICTEFGMASTRAASDHLDALARKGEIKRKEGLSRGIVFLKDVRPKGGVSIPLVGRVAAGQPVLALENVVDRFTLDESIARGDDTFLLEVQGESMIDAHICPGDYIIVKSQQTAEDGDIVVALIEDEATVKRLERRGSRIRLLPENATMSPIPIPRLEDLHILGVVTGLVRRTI